MTTGPIKRVMLCAILAFVVAGCASSSAKGDAAALILEPDAKSRLALQNAVSRTLGVSYVALADDALTKDSVLTIEPTRIRDFEGRRLQGRETRAPEIFKLIAVKKDCYLVHERTGTRTLLANTRCKKK